MSRRKTKRVIGAHRKQLEFYLMQEQVRGYVGGRGVGKTHVGALYICLNAENKAPWMVVSPDHNVIEETTWPTFEGLAKSMGIWIRGVKSPVRRAFIRTWDGGKTDVVFKSAERPDKLVGSNKAGLWFDEASIMCHEAFLFAIPVLRWKGKTGPCLLTFTPRGRKHWTFGTFFEDVSEDERILLEDPLCTAIERGEYMEISGRYYRRKEGAGIVHARSIENPFLPPDYTHLIGSHLTSALRQQELEGAFIDLEGMLFRREWFYPLVDIAPIDALRVRYWDRAATPDSGCFSAGVLMSRTKDGLYWVEDVVRGQWSAEERNRIILETAKKDSLRYGNTVRIYGEQEGGSAGREISEQFVKMLSGYPVYRDIVSGSRSRMVDGIKVPGDAKVVRAMPMAAQAEARNIRVVRAKWTEDYLDELSSAPESQFFDQFDASSGAFNKLASLAPMDPGPITRLPNKADPHSHGIPMRLHAQENPKF